MASDIILDHVYTSLCGLSSNKVTQKARELATHYGVSIKTVFNWAGKRGMRFRAEKANKGASKVDGEMVRAASALLYASRRTSKKIPLPACDARMILDDAGVETGGVSTSWFVTRMRQEQVSKRHLLSPTPHRRLLSKHPNHVWQFDVSNCIQYFLDQNKGMGERDEDMTLYKNKIVKTAREIKKQLLRYAVVDHCSGAFYFRYFYATGERAIDGSTFLYEAMRPKDELIKKTVASGDTMQSPSRQDAISLSRQDAVSLSRQDAAPTASPPAPLGKYRFHGVPFMLVADRGSIAAAKANQGLFDALRIELVTHLPGNPRAKGAVEGLMAHIERFEAKLRLQRPAGLDELNRWALDWCIYDNGVPLMRNVAPRSVLWGYITQEQLRLCPDEELYRLLIREPTIGRTADGSCHISVDGMVYAIPDSQAAGQHVAVVRHPYERPAVEVHFNGHVWLCRPIPMDQYGRPTDGVLYGEYKAHTQTPTQKAQTEMERIAEGWGLTWRGTGDKRRAEAPPAGFESPLAVFGNQAEKVGNVEFIEKRGLPLEIKAQELPENTPITSDAATVSRGIAPRQISFGEFLKQVRSEIGVIPPAMNADLRAQYEAGIEIREAREVIEAIQEGAWPAPAAERVNAQAG